MFGFGQVYIPELNFKGYLAGSTNINTNGDNEKQLSEAIAYTSNICCDDMNISDLTGIEAFTYLGKLDCSNNTLISLDVSNNTFLNDLRCDNNQPYCLDISTNPNLSDLHCSDNLLEQYKH